VCSGTNISKISKNRRRVIISRLRGTIWGYPLAGCTEENDSNRSRGGKSEDGDNCCGGDPQGKNWRGIINKRDTQKEWFTTEKGNVVQNIHGTNGKANQWKKTLQRAASGG